MTTEQCRTARRLLGLSQSRLAHLAGLSQTTVSAFERGRVLQQCTLDTIRAALKAAGIIFADGEASSVRLRPSAVRSVVMSAEQCVQARQLLGWTKARLYGFSSVCEGVVTKIEQGQPVRRDLVAKVQAAFEESGIDFSNDDAPSVRLRPNAAA